MKEASAAAQGKLNFDLESVLSKQQELDDAAVATVKHGGKATEQLQEDQFATAFTRWPGIHNLLKYNQTTADKNWHRITCRHVTVYLLLGLLSGVSIYTRYTLEYYWLRQGALQTI